ncbi:hypothetical protein RR46_03756 [Papilio xuthus]|uniref:Uncharacterized protein n=1 Tax=Papilio xuthus TaxID=66420 RepID=A0A194Q1G2_PAPXU|nr:hypothetical protein RR46_03756 [Papilio xuthus]
MTGKEIGARAAVLRGRLVAREWNACTMTIIDRSRCSAGYEISRRALTMRLDWQRPASGQGDSLFSVY